MKVDGKDDIEQPGSAPKRYPHNALEGFGNGALFDFRVRFAMTLLASSQRYAPLRVAKIGDPHYDALADGVAPVWSPQDAAEDALNLADALFAEAERRGLVDPITTDTTMTPELRAQATRTAQFGVLQQIEGQRYAQDEQSRVVAPAPGIQTPKH